MQKAVQYLVLLCCVWAVLPAPLQSQEGTLPRAYSPTAVAAANAGLGAVATLVGQAIRGKGLEARNVAKGAAGGLIVYGGKAVVARNLWYANLIGREVAAIGSSGIHNVSAGHGFFDRVSLPYGPMRVNIDRLPRRKVRLKFDLARVIVLGTALSDVHLDMQVGRSILYGVPVFRDNHTAGHGYAAGSHVGGVVTYREETFDGFQSADEMRSTLGHELVHVVQADFSFRTWGGPIETALMNENETSRALHVFFDLGLDVPLASLVNSMIVYRSRPWEREAVSLAR